MIKKLLTQKMSQLNVDEPSHSGRVEIIISEINSRNYMKYDISEELHFDLDDFSDEKRKLLVDFTNEVKTLIQKFSLSVEKMLSDKSYPFKVTVSTNHHDAALPDIEEVESDDENMFDNEDKNVNVDPTAHNTGPDDEILQKIATEFASEDIDALKKVAEEKKKSEDDYFRRTLLLSKMEFRHEESSYYKTCIKVLKNHNLISLFDNCEKFYVTQKGDIRLTFATRRECIHMLLQAKRILQHDYRRGVKISVEIMCPRAELKKKMRLKSLGRRAKEQGKIHSYDVVQTKEQGNFVLKLRIYKRGVGYRVLNEAEIERAVENIEEFLPNNEE